MAAMTFGATLAWNLTLLLLALFMVVLRLFVRLTRTPGRLTLSDYFVILAWFCLLGFFLCVTLASSWGALDYYVTGAVYTIGLQKVLYTCCLFYDWGLYMPKASLLALYYDIVPDSFRKQRLALYLITGYTAVGFIVCACIDFFFCWPISREWDVDPVCSVWTSNVTYRINFGLNISCDILVFALPFSLLQYLRVNKKQKVGLIGTLLLGLVTITTGILRYEWIDIDYSFSPSVIWCSAETCASIIVVSLPPLKCLLGSRSKGSRSSSEASSSWLKVLSRRRNRGYSHAEDIPVIIQPEEEEKAVPLGRDIHDSCNA